MTNKTNKLTICLIKTESTNFDSIVISGTNPHEIEGIGTFYTEDSHPRTPAWIHSFFGNTLDDSLKLITSSAKGVLLTRVTHEKGERIFALTFGHGRFLLEKGVIEERFGLKVVLNSVDSQNLRSIDKTTLGSVTKQSREQISREGDVANFGIDIEQDLVNSVTGKAHDTRLGKTISGRDSLSISTKVDISNVTKILEVCLEQYLSDAYKTNFDWIDQIQDIRNPLLIDELNALVITKLQNRELSKIWMAAPEVIDWVDVKGFRYIKGKRSELKADLDIVEFLDVLQERQLSYELLKQTSIFLVSAKTDDIADYWDAYKCLYAEIEYNKRIYTLNQGKWYEIANDFSQQILQSFDETQQSLINFPEYAHEDEGAYNESLSSTIDNAYCMDRKLIMHGGGHNKIEFCDILTTDKSIVHIKRYSGSSQLSHLFAQGVVSGELPLCASIEHKELRKLYAHGL